MSHDVAKWNDDDGAAARAVATLLGSLVRDVAPGTAEQARTLDVPEQRRILAAALTTRPPAPLPAGAEALLDQLLTWENSRRPVTDTGVLPRLREAGAGARLSLWQGDITTLAADAIVNAANDRMLGCFVPGHACIDNAIHAIAGPALRAECADHMTRQGHLEPTGAATLTGGYHLPAQYVLHTVGPIVPSHQPTATDAAALASCYRSCLETARTHGAIGSVAFSAISTGVFGYPIDAAAAVAVETVTDWLDTHPDTNLHVVFNTFSDRDNVVYRSTLESRLS